MYFSKSAAVGPSSRYRIYQYLPCLEAVGIECAVRPLWGVAYFFLLSVRIIPLRILGKTLYSIVRFLKRLLDIVTMGKPDLVVLEGPLFPYCPLWGERLLKWMGQKLVIELDDAIYLTPGHQRKIPALLAMASVAIVGNEVLAQYARRHTAQVFVIPTVVDTQRFVPAQAGAQLVSAATEKPVTVVWIGLAYNLEYLDIVAPVLKELQDKGLIKFRVVCSRPPRLPGLTVEFRAWQLEREVEVLQDCHIGIMPLPSTEWSEGKCGLKLLQYMSIGMATVASPVGVNRDILSGGEAGFLAATEQDWRDKLTRLCQDEALRERMGCAARTTVEERYSLHVWGPRLAKQYQEIVDDERSVRVGNLMARSLNRYH